MSVIGRAIIEKRLGMALSDLKALVITPLKHDEKGHPCIDRDSVDLRLGCRFLIPRVHQFSGSGTAPRNKHEAAQTVHIPHGQKIQIPAHGTILGTTLEYLKLPYDFSGEVLTRSSLARKFITIETAPWIHPLYRGCLTLEIANASNIPIAIGPGDTIAQLVLLRVVGAVRPPTDEMESVYLGPIFPEA